MTDIRNSVGNLDVASGGRGPFTADRVVASPFNGTPFWWRVYDIPATADDDALQVELNSDADGDFSLTISQETETGPEVVVLGKAQAVALAGVVAEYIKDGRIVTPPFDTRDLR